MHVSKVAEVLLEMSGLRKSFTKIVHVGYSASHDPLKSKHAIHVRHRDHMKR